MVSVKLIKREHIRLVANKTDDLGAAAQVLGIGVSTLYRFREKNGLGRPDRTPLEDDAENFTDD